MKLVVVSGHPGTGKTTLARALGSMLRLPVIEKDQIKEALYRVLGAPDLDSSRRLGAASYELMYSLARSFEVLILESNFARAAREAIVKLDPRAIEVHCVCDPEVALSRYAARARGGPHFDEEMLPELERRFLEDGQQPLAAGGPVLDVDTTHGVSIGDVAVWVAGHLGIHPPE